jgi:hypothetical protein
MSQRAAVAIAAALAAFTLIGALALSARLVRGNVATVAVSETAASDALAETDPEQDDAYRQASDRLQEANAALAASYERITTLLDDVAALQAQNAQLREREALYQQRLAEANTRLQQQGQAAIEVRPTARASGERRDARSQSGDRRERD